MGLIQAALASAGGVLGDQWKEFFYCDSLSSDILVAKGHRRKSSSWSSNDGSDNIITNGSKIAVNDGQCMMIVTQGKVVDFCADAGRAVFAALATTAVARGTVKQAMVILLVWGVDRIANPKRGSQPSRATGCCVRDGAASIFPATRTCP